MPYPEPDRLISLHLNAPGAPGLSQFRSELRLSASMYLTFDRHNHAFQSLGVWGPGTASITGIAQPEQVKTAEISGGVLETLNVPALAGQWLTAGDQDAHGLGRVMLSYGYWQRRFGGDPRVVGRTINVDSQVAGDCRGYAAGIQDRELTTSICWRRWRFDQTKRVAGGASRIAASGGSSQGLRFRRRMPMRRG